MSKKVNLVGVLKPLRNEPPVTEDVFVSDRLGTFTFKKLTQSEFEAIQHKYPEKDIKNNTRFASELIVSSIVEPNLRSKEILESFGTLDVHEVIKEGFYKDELFIIESKVSELLGLKGIVAISKEAKN